MLNDQLIYVRLTPEIARAVINNPYVTYDDLDALYFMVTNDPDMGWGSPLLTEISQAMNAIQFPKMEVCDVRI